MLKHTTLLFSLGISSLLVGQINPSLIKKDIVYLASDNLKG